MFVNYSVTELPEHLKKRRDTAFFSGCIHDTTTVCSLELYSYFYYFRCFQSGYGQFFCTVHCKKSDNTGKYTKLHYFVELL